MKSRRASLEHLGNWKIDALTGIDVALCYCYLGAGLAEPGGCPPIFGCEETSNSMRFYRRKRFFVLGAVALLFAWLQFQVPSNEGPWNHAQARTSWVEFEGRYLTVHNLRDFRYGPDFRAVSTSYVDQDFNLDNLQRGWFGLSHFGPLGMAHSFLSFEFDTRDGPRYLALSIEARLRPDQKYKPLVGMFRRYTKISVFSTEQDVIGLRSHLRGERVLLYPVDSTREKLETFFLTMINDANALHEAPAFYNTVFDNCLTNLLKNSALADNLSFGDLRVLLPGRSDRITYALDITPNDLPFDEARERATVDPAHAEISDDNFSASLRCGWTAEACKSLNSL